MMHPQTCGMKCLMAIMPLVLLWVFIQPLSAQTSIKGQVTDTNGDAISRINIMVYLPDNKSMLAFALSDEKGNFEISVHVPFDSLFVKVSSINYSDIKRMIPNISQHLEFKLSVEIKELESISIKAAPVEKRGDTLSYLVSSFARSEDRAIEDVLRRMPGIEVEPNGKILYQGMPINKFYVEGLDLMEGRYSLVSKNLPQGSVAAVEVLENHQPLLMLENKVESQQAALNLKIKNGITTTGLAQLGAGLSPFLRDVNVTPMTFTKKFQVVTSLQSNNTGNDVSQQVSVFTSDNLKRNGERPAEYVEMLNVLSATPPEIKPNRYLDNNIFLLNFNGLQRLNEDFKLRTNIYYTYDDQNAKTEMLRTIYTLDDTLKFSEKFDNQLTTHNLYANFNINRNVKKNYLNNDLKIQGGWNNQHGIIDADSSSIAQSLSSPLRSISNDLRSYNTIGKHIWEFQSFILFDHNPHKLSVVPGQFDYVFNSTVPNNQLIQHINLKRFFADNSAGFVFSYKLLTFSPRAGITYQEQTLLSHISNEENNKENMAATEFANDISTRSTIAYVSSDLEFKSNKLTVKESISMSTNKVNIADQKTDTKQQTTQFLISSKLSSGYKFNGFWRLTGSWHYDERLSTYDEFYSGFIMKNYRSLSQNIVSPSTVPTHKLSSRLEYRNQIISFFNTFDYIYSVSRFENTSNNLIADDGSSVIITQNMPKTSSSHYMQFYTSKFISKTKTTFNLRVNYIQQQGKSLVNNVLFNTKNHMLNIRPELSWRITPWMNLDYALNTNSVSTFINQQKKSRISLLKHNIGFFIFPVKNQLISLNAEYYNHNSTDFLFVDVLYRYTFTQRKIDLELKCNNIFNTSTYTSFLANAYSVWETTYTLRPFQLLFSGKFSF